MDNPFKTRSFKAEIPILILECPPDILASFPVAVTKCPDKGSLGDKGFPLFYSVRLVSLRESQGGGTLGSWFYHIYNQGQRVKGLCACQSSASILHAHSPGPQTRQADRPDLGYAFLAKLIQLRTSLSQAKQHTPLNPAL